MMNLVNNFGGQNQPVRQNPDEYAKSYAEQNGISFEEAKAELKAKYGDPQQQGGAPSIGSFGNMGNVGSQDISGLQEEIASLEEKLFGGQESGNSILSFLMNILKGNNNSEDTNANNSSNKTETTEKAETTETTEKTETTKTDSKSNRIKEYKDQTLYKYLKNVRGLSDSEIKALSSDEEKAYKKDCQKHIDARNRQYYGG